MSDPSMETDDTHENGDSGSRIRSKISFPYTPLADAEQVAEALHRRGDTATMDELAAELKQTITSGAFRTKVSTARTFGAIEVRRGQVVLTPLGRRLIDPAQVAKARADAFLHVPLYRQVYEKYKGHTLPPPEGVEREMERLGVSPKQTDRARQALQRSAERAGFFGNGRDRLVAPALGSDQEGHDNPPPPARERREGGGTLPNPVEELIVTLLDEGGDWTPAKTHEYVAAARTIYEMLS
jgi:hypothetical protein